METLTRRTALKLGGAAIIAGTLPPWLLEACTSGGGTPSGGFALQLGNEKGSWGGGVEQEGAASKNAGRSSSKIQDYAHTNTYHAAIVSSCGSSKMPALFTLWSGW